MYLDELAQKRCRNPDWQRKAISRPTWRPLSWREQSIVSRLVSISSIARVWLPVDRRRVKFRSALPFRSLGRAPPPYLLLFSSIHDPSGEFEISSEEMRARLTRRVKSATTTMVEKAAPGWWMSFVVRIQFFYHRRIECERISRMACRCSHLFSNSRKISFTPICVCDISMKHYRVIGWKGFYFPCSTLINTYHTYYKD